MFSAGLPVYALQYLYSDSSIIPIRSHVQIHVAFISCFLSVVRVVYFNLELYPVTMAGNV